MSGEVPGGVSASNFGYIAMNLCPKSETKDSAALQYGEKIRDVELDIGFCIRTTDDILESNYQRLAKF